MKSKVIAGIVLTLLVYGLLTLAFNIRPVRADPTTIIVPDNYVTIQEAINAANDGDTIYVRTGTYYEHIFVNKSLSLIGENSDNTVIDGSGAGIVLEVEVLNVTITGFTIQNGETGIRPSSYAKIHDNKIRKNSAGIAWSMPMGYLIENVTISDNIITDNNDSGILFSGYNSYHIIQNNIISHSEYGIYIFPHWEHVIIGNTIASNNYGIYINSFWEEGNSSIYRNNFINNTYQAYLEGSHNYKWDDGYPSGGNYWSDYTGVDAFSGPNQNQPGSDGIGDTPYVIDADNVDHYPLMPRTDAFPKGRYSCPDYTRAKNGDINGDGIPDWFYEAISDDTGRSVELWGVDPDGKQNWPILGDPYDEYFAVIFGDETGKYFIGKCPFGGGVNSGFLKYTGDLNANEKPDYFIEVKWRSEDGGSDDPGSAPGRDAWEYILDVLPTKTLTETHYDKDGNILQKIIRNPVKWQSPGEFNDLEPIIVDFRWDDELMLAQHYYPSSVGGIYISVNKLELLAPYIGLTILLTVSVSIAVYVRKGKSNQFRRS